MFPANFGHAAIDNYIAGKDTIQFDHASFATPAAALAAAHDDGHGSVVIADAAHDALTLHNITVAQLPSTPISSLIDLKQIVPPLTRAFVRARQDGASSAARLRQTRTHQRRVKGLRCRRG